MSECSLILDYSATFVLDAWFLWRSFSWSLFRLLVFAVLFHIRQQLQHRLRFHLTLLYGSESFTENAFTHALIEFFWVLLTTSFSISNTFISCANLLITNFIRSFTSSVSSISCFSCVSILRVLAIWSVSSPSVTPPISFIKFRNSTGFPICTARRNSRWRWLVRATVSSSLISTSWSSSTSTKILGLSWINLSIFTRPMPLTSALTLSSVLIFFLPGRACQLHRDQRVGVVNFRFSLSNQYYRILFGSNFIDTLEGDLSTKS